MWRQTPLVEALHLLIFQRVSDISEFQFLRPSTSQAAAWLR